MLFLIPLSFVSTCKVKPYYCPECNCDGNEQGGLLVIETAALTVFFGYYTFFLHHVEDILLGVRSHDKNIGKSELGGDIRTFNDKNIMDSDEVVLHSISRTRLALLELEVFCFDISQLSLVLAAEDKSGIFILLLLTIPWL